jgi:hypothetical protein
MRSRRALSSVVGAVFSIIALSTVIGYVTYSMNVLDKYNQSILTTNANALDRSKEDIQVTRVTIDNSKFNITASNAGNIPIHLTRLWVTNTTDVGKVFKYDINYNLSPGQSQIKIGQSLPIYAKTNQAYDLKLITDRGNVKEFTVNSVGTTPINIQLVASPPSVASGFKTQLIMMVTNNQSGTLTNLVPNISLNPGNTATCVADPVIPSSYNTLPPGGTAIFTTGVKVTGATDGQTCTFKAQLANGYAKNNANSTITMNIINLSSTSYATNSGVISDTYTSFGWTQGGSWHNHWSFPSATITDFKITITNNNQTSGNYKLWLSKNTQLYILQTLLPANGKIVATPFFITSTIPSNPPTPPTLTAYTDYSVGVPNSGGQQTLYFGASAAGGSTQQSTANLQPGTYFGFVLVYGKFAVDSEDTGSSYAQAIPFLAVVMS